MKAQTEGFEVLIGVAALIFAVALAYIVLSGGGVKSELPEGQPEEKFCKDDDSCKGDDNGERCMQIRTSKGLQQPFCGCVTDEDCKSEVCGAENVCVPVSPD